MLEEISLPSNTECFRCPLFPFAYNHLRSLIGPTKTYYDVDMVRHHDGKMRVPDLPVVAMLDGLD